MRSVTASLVAWSGRGPLLWAMGCPCRELTMRRRLAAPHRGGPDAGDRTAVPADRAASPAAVLHRALVCDPGRAGHRSPVGCRPTNRHRDVAGRGPGRACALVARAPLLRSRGVGPGPGRPGTGPRGRGPPGARRWRGHRGGGRHAVSPLRQEGARREVPARRLRQGPGRHRPRQLLCDRRCRGGGAVPGPPGLPAGAVPLHIPKTGASKTEQARAMVDLLARPCPGAPSTWWRRPASADRPGAACPPASLHHPPGRQRGPAPTRTRRTGRRGHPAWKGERLGTAADVAATTTWTRTRVTRYRLTEDVDMAVVTCLWWAACTAPPSAWSWSAAPARPDPTPWPRPPPT